MNNLIRYVILMTKLFIFAFTIQCMTMSFLFGHESHAQIKDIEEVKISLNVKDVSIERAMETIEKRSGFRFVYTVEEMVNIPDVTVEGGQSSVYNILRTIAIQTGLEFRQMNKNIHVRRGQLSENYASVVKSMDFIEVSGLVTDESGEPLPGASVLVEGANTGTVTDIDGRYTLEVPEGGVLVFSYVGFVSKTVPISNQTNINVQLEPDATSLEEVVVVGYGTQKKANISGAIAQIEPKNLQERPIQRVDQALIGQMAGVRVKQTTGVPGRGYEIQIRGTGSITANNQPLYVIDGFPLESSGANPLDNLSPNDIESIQVLKDASSAAIYGSRASNGVVIINTKRGKKGKANISFNSYMGWNETVKKLDVLSPTEWIDRSTEMINHAWVNSGPNRTASQLPAEREAILGTFNPNLIYDERWFQEGNPGIQLVPWQDELFRKGIVQSYQLTASGANENVNYYVAGDYLDQEGIAINVNYKRYSARANVEINANEKLKFGLNLNPTYAIQNDPGVEGKDAITHTTVGMAPVVEADAGLNTGVGDIPLYAWGSSRISPIATANHRSRESTIFRILTTIYGDYEFLEGLSLRSTVNLDHTDSQTKTYTPGLITNNNNTTGSFGGFRKQTFVNENTLSYNKTFNNSHNVSAVAGISYNFSRIGDYNISGNFNVDGIQTLNAAIINAGGTSTSESQATLLSYFGRVQYDYNEKYLFSASIRRDGSSRFGNDTKWGVFPSASIGWRISDEEFLVGQEMISDLKARASWGLSGNNGIGDYSHIATMNFANYSLGGMISNGLVPGNFPNPMLGWEESEMYNWGLDFGLFQNRVYSSVDVYTKTNTNLLLNIPVPSATGFSTALTNIGKVRNRGWEVELTTRNLVGDFTWTTNFNFSNNTNEVLQLGPENTPILGGSWDINHNITMVGQPMYSYYLVQQDGILTAEDIENEAALFGNQQVGDPKYVDANDDGVIDPDDRVLSGFPNPTHFWGITNNFTYKGFDLNILVQGQWGGQIYSTFGRAMDRPGMSFRENTLGRHRNRWQSPEEPGDGMTGKAVSSFGRIKNTDWLYPSDYWRIRNITLGYNLGRILSQANLFSTARVYATAENWFGGDQYAGGFNPEAVNNNGDDYGAFPLARSIIFGLNLNF